MVLVLFLWSWSGTLVGVKLSFVVVQICNKKLSSATAEIACDADVGAHRLSL